ncbi:unnamed protein product [Ceutorhynchus assimilis]|uniref:Uncharacterized protein n=1 Tax=Ceutorhynchus assimilis TaxID=467358 RepID=A0A9N9QMH7_9CUCU|nr:unnamed protein product [Ceutorhynchus assimilis]
MDSDDYSTEDSKKRKMDEFFGNNRRSNRTPRNKKDKRLEEMLALMKGMSADQKELKEELLKLKGENEVRKTIEIIDKERRKNNVVMNGLKFDNNEPEVLVKDVKAFLNQQLKVNITPKSVTRIAERTWIIELQNEVDKRKIMENKTKLKGHERRKSFYK